MLATPLKTCEGAINLILYDPTDFTVVSPKERVNYEWDFGDGKVLTGAEVNYNFEKDGVYEVKLKAVVGGDFCLCLNGRNIC